MGDVISKEDIPLTMSTMGTPNMNPFFSKDEQELKIRVDAKIVEEPEGSPLFLLFNLIGENNTVIPVAFDSCSSYTLLDSVVPTRMLHAAPANLPQREKVRGIGGVRKTKNLTVLMPLANKSYQVVTAQTVDSLLFVPQVCTDLGMKFLKQECRRQNININDVALDSFIGGQILGLIGISNPELQPQLEYLSPTGLGLY